MPSSLFPECETERLADLYSCNILDTPPEEDFTDIVELVAYICQTPIAHISLIDSERSWHKARKGLAEQELPRQFSFCTHTIFSGHPVIVEDARKDERFADNPSVVDDPFIRFYAGYPLVTNGGQCIGTLCVVDIIPRNLNEHQLTALDLLAKQVMKLIEERKRTRQLQQATRLEQQRNAKLQRITDTQRQIMGILGHDTKGPLFYINRMIRTMIAEEKINPDMQSGLELISNQLDATLILIEDLLDWSRINVLNAEEHEEMFSLEEMLALLMEPLEYHARKKSNRLINLVPPTLFLHKYARVTAFLLRNLLVNAIKFTSNGTITVRATRQDQWLQITVTDTGIGMTSDQVAEVLGRESKSTRGTSNEAGSGLGYLLIHEFLDQINGSLELHSEPGKGTSVILYIPA
jgi:signal transduction histidine kinase